MSKMGHTASSYEVVARLEREGCGLDRIAGSHHIFIHPGRPEIVLVPHPRKDLPMGTLRSIYKMAGWDWTNRRLQ